MRRSVHNHKMCIELVYFVKLELCNVLDVGISKIYMVHETIQFVIFSSL